MSLADIGGFVPVGAPSLQGIPATRAPTSVLVDAANEAVIMIGRIETEDRGSHTIDTTGSSSIGVRLGSVTNVNASTRVKIGIGAIATGTPVRAANASNVITFDVSKTHSGGGGTLTANAWNESVPDSGTKTIAHGDIVALSVQMTVLGGADLVNVGVSAPFNLQGRPSVTAYQSAAYADQAKLPNAVITFSDGTLGWFSGGYVTSAINTQTWNSTSATKEYGNLLQFPAPVRAYGIFCEIAPTNDLDLILYSDPLGTPVAQKTVNIANNTWPFVTRGLAWEPFPAPYDIPANTPVGVIAKPGASNVSMLYSTMGAAGHQKTLSLGANSYAINRATGAFAAQNSGQDRYPIGLMVSAFESPITGKIISAQRGSPY